MTPEDPPAGDQNLTITDSQVGTASVGSHNVVMTTGGGEVVIKGLDAEAVAEVFAALVPLRAQALAEVPPAEQVAARARINDLETALTAPQPDPRKASEILCWFRTHVPKLAGAVAGVLLTPAVSPIVPALGEAAVADIEAVHRDARP